DVVLGPGEQPAVAVPLDGGGDRVAVGAGVRLGERERHLPGPGGHAGEPVALHLLGAVPPDDRGGDGGRDDAHQRRHAVRRQFLQHHGVLAQAAPAAAVFLGQVYAEETALAQLGPEFVDPAAGAGPIGEVGVTVPLGDLADALPEQPLFWGVDVHGY